MATPMFDKIRKMNSTTPAVQLMKKTAEQQRRKNAAATGTPYKITSQTPTTSTPTNYGVYTGNVSSSYVPGTLGNQKVNRSSGSSGGSSSSSNITPTTPIVETERPPWIPEGDRDWDTGGDGLTASNYYQQMLDEQQKAIQERINAAVQANNAYIPQVNQQSDQSLQNAYILREQNRANAPQALSAMGYTGGAAESSLMGINTGYENTRNQIEQSRNQSLNDIRQNEQQIRSTGDASLSDVASQYYTKMAEEQKALEAAQKSDFINSIGAYGNDYMAQYNNVMGDNDPTNDYQAAYLLQARNQKLNDQASATAKKEQQDKENYIKLQQMLYNTNKPYFAPKSSGGGTYSESDINSMYDASLIDEATWRQMLRQLYNL